MPNDSDYTYGNDMDQMEPYMFSDDKNLVENPIENKDFIVQDLEYLQGLYPGHIKRLQEYVVSACDHLDYKSSPIYDEFPDRILIHQICDSICSQILTDGILAEGQLPEEEREAFDPGNSSVEIEEWGEEANERELLSKQNSNSWGPPGPNRPWGPPWGPPPGPNRPWGPPWGPPGPNRPWGPSWGPNQPCGNPWGPPCKNPWGPYPGSNQPWGPPWDGPRPGKNNPWLTDVVSVLLLNEMHRRRCASGRCR
ncbi:hypothetical protein [Lacrimispora sp.]|uniref:hypothetical protein n=1 Tax=Lacrimispora sp. TaxID=2719234 RepID=UPI0028AC7139|nr:hypothetical protein [Lacrimispora sp.]